MLTTANTQVMNMLAAIRGMRNPMNSWDRMDSYLDENGNCLLGPNDLDLAMRLTRAGSDDRKFLRQIFVSVDITGPLYWWKEFDTYKVGTVANSTSTMHKLHAKPIERGDFSTDQMSPETIAHMDQIVEWLESLRKNFVETRDKAVWYDLIQLLPSSYNQMRTCTLNYENLINIYHARKNHKLEEWHVLCRWIESLPYAQELIVRKGEAS
ncbi:MAG: hypothetical protein ACOX6P_03330 [Candidatus Merdivicinus sp.]